VNLRSMTLESSSEIQRYSSSIWHFQYHVTFSYNIICSGKSCYSCWLVILSVAMWKAAFCKIDDGPAAYVPPSTRDWICKNADWWFLTTFLLFPCSFPCSFRLLQEFTGFTLDKSHNIQWQPRAEWVTCEGLKGTDKVHPGSHLTMFVRVSIIIL
jgi:hypothetical protein